MGFGVEPVFSTRGPGGVVSSRRLADLLDTPGLAPEPDARAIDCLLTLEYIPAPLTIFKGIEKSWEGCGPVEFGPVSLGEKEYAARLRELLAESVRACIGEGEVPGVWLSGGLDSSAIVATMGELDVAPIRTFSVGFEEESYDELGYARLVARRFGTQHTEEVMVPASPDLARKVVEGLDEPLADLGLISTFTVAGLAARDVGAVLSGEGADELLAGYDCHVAARIDRLYRRLPRWIRQSLIPGALGMLPPSGKKRGVVNSIKRFAEGAALPSGMGHLRWRMHLKAATRDALYTQEFKEELDGWDPLAGPGRDGLSHDDLERALAADLERYLPGSMLTKAMSAGRANSLEVGFPFLEDPFVDFACGIPAGLKLKGLKRKYVFKRAMEGLLPREIIKKRKEGFSVPMKHWLRGSLKPLLLDLLSEERVNTRKFFQPSEVNRLVEEHLSGKKNRSHVLWALVVLELWLEKLGA
jgi:asparagine synthase (glutamine-hydrolysing)